MVESLVCLTPALPFSLAECVCRVQEVLCEVSGLSAADKNQLHPVLATRRVYCGFPQK